MIVAIRSGVALRQLGLLLAIVFCVSVTACGTQQAQSGQAPTRVPRASDKPLRPAPSGGRISPLLSANFALLHTPPDGIPLAANRALAASIPGIKWNLARRIPGSLPGRYWLVPGIANICVVARTPESPAVGAVCATVDQALHHGIASTSLDPISGRRVIVGVVPIGTRAVLVRSGATTSSVRVVRGHFILRDSAAVPPDELTLR